MALNGNGSKARQENKQKRTFLNVIIWVSLAMFLVTVIWILFAAIVWPAQNSNYFNKPISFTDESEVLVRIPLVVPSEDIPLEVEFTFFRENCTSSDKKIEVTAPPDIILLDPLSGARSQKVTLIFDSCKVAETKTIKIRNAKTQPCILLSKTNLFVLEIAGEDEAKKPIGIPIQIEPNLRATIRRYGGGGTEAPFLPLITLLISLAGLIYRDVEDKRLSQKEEDEKERQRDTAAKKIEEIRSFIKSQNMDGAEEVLNRCIANPQFDLKDKVIAQKLLQIANGHVGNDKKIEQFAGWKSELASALIYAAGNRPEDAKNLSRLFREFPEDTIDLDIKVKFDSAKTSIGSGDPLQSRERILPAEVELPLFSPSISGLDKNPFPQAKAELEENILFSKPNLFWARHPLWEKLQNVKGGALVYGQSGSGKTALGLALGKYREDKDTFSCYIPGTPDMQKIREIFTERLVLQIIKFPSFLILLSDEQRILLGELLVDEFGKEKAARKIDFIDLSEILQEESAGSEQIWKAQITTHLDLLKKAIAAAPFHHFADNQWLSAFSVCVRALEFSKKIYFVIDAGDEFTLEWYQDTILRRRDSWLEMNFCPIVFSSQPIPERELKENFWVKSFELTWDAAQIAEMAKYRWESVYRVPPFVSILPDTSLAQMIKLSQNNPRCFIRLWNEAAKNNVKTPFTVQSVRKAKEKISCR